MCENEPTRTTRTTRMSALKSRSPKGTHRRSLRSMPAISTLCTDTATGGFAILSARPMRRARSFSKRWLRCRGYRGGSFRSWLFAIAHNVVIDTIRQTKPQSMLPDEWDLPDDQPTPEQRTILEDDRRRLWNCSTS